MRGSYWDFKQKAGHVTCIELSEKRSLINAYRNKGSSNIKILLGNFQDIEIDEKYDYVTLIGVWEYSGLYVEHPTPYLKMLEIVKSYLKKDGKIIIAIENKMGLKYWNGASEDHTGKLYSGLNDYTDCPKLRTFSKPEIECILKEAGISEYTFIILCQIINFQRPFIVTTYCQCRDGSGTMEKTMINVEFIILMML